MGSIEVTFRCSDSDSNGRNDFYTDDVAGLYFTQAPGGIHIRMIEISVAQADGAPRRAYVPPATMTAHPKAGYWYFALRGCEDLDGVVTPYGARNDDRFGFTAVPDQYRTPRDLIFTTNEAGTLYKIDPRGNGCFQTRPKAGSQPAAGALAWPYNVWRLDPRQYGWSKLD